MRDRLKLAPERRKELIEDLKSYIEEHHDESIGDLKAGLLLDFLLDRVGPAIYNQGARDTQGYLQDKLQDVEYEVFIPETER